MLNMSSYQRFIQAAALHYKQHPGVMSETLGELLVNFEVTEDILKDKNTSKNNPSFTIDSHSLLPDIINKSKHPLLAYLNDCYESLQWRSSGFGRLPTEITKHIAVVEIVGPDGMIKDQQLRFGLLLQDPNIIYAKHQHAAEELYLVLSGEASWAVDDNEASVREVNEFIHHAENQPHQMTTNNEPLLAMWAWLGDIGAESYSIGI